ncbi:MULTISPECIES: hypothetical protein [unclassified Microbacterium]|uniref:hypothetical protein n=1 Tax=unclassified Microbacterium TaxID=2609290 RepID=UPI00214B7C92|nr:MULTISPECIES: hypothetical protein [unclassified Microbacterium]MCR2810033.1 hypothetical protein [Microbacterium sp. zg.B185]WIM20127.1 hypothetical protein QNO12_04780 [Microbacterium sp. zg-B185]
MTVGAALLWATESAPLWAVIVPYLVFGLGFGLIADPISVTALGSLPPAQAGLASSLISTSKQWASCWASGGSVLCSPPRRDPAKRWSSRTCAGGYGRC